MTKTIVKKNNEAGDLILYDLQIKIIMTLFSWCKQESNRNLLYSTGNCTQCSVVT